MRIANTVQDSIVDGPGLRFTVFTQGCPHHCPGCHNPLTHDPQGGEAVTPESLCEKLRENPLLRGLTLSGGEPFLQSEACAKLAACAHGMGLDVWTYTGYHYEELLAGENPGWRQLLAETDVLVDGPFLQELRSYDCRFRGSTNQRLIDIPRSLQTGRTVLWREPEDLLSKFTVPES